MRKAIAIVSGGLDSVTMAYQLRAEGYALELLSFDYGQRHRRELACAVQQAHLLGAAHEVIDLSALRSVLRGSALTDDVAVPDGHYTAPSMAVTVVPNRNAIMLAIAFARAVVVQASAVAVGVHSGDHAIYPDCRPEFVQSFDAMQRLAVEGFGHPDLCLLAPFVRLTKADIVRLGALLGVPFEHTWSCYKGAATHCGTCGTCVERKEAFVLSGIPDPTEYNS